MDEKIVVKIAVIILTIVWIFIFTKTGIDITQNKQHYPKTRWGTPIPMAKGICTPSSFIGAYVMEEECSFESWRWKCVALINTNAAGELTIDYECHRYEQTTFYYPDKPLALNQ